MNSAQYGAIRCDAERFEVCWYVGGVLWPDGPERLDFRHMFELRKFELHDTWRLLRVKAALSLTFSWD